MYKTYPPAYDQIPLPHKYKLPDFTKFSGQGEVSTVEHINRFIMQCGEAANQDALRVRLFSMSLSGSAFTWYTTLLANSIYIMLGRSGETVSPVHLLWHMRDEADGFNRPQAE